MQVPQQFKEQSSLLNNEAEKLLKVASNAGHSLHPSYRQQSECQCVLCPWLPGWAFKHRDFWFFLFIYLGFEFPTKIIL